MSRQAVSYLFFFVAALTRGAAGLEIPITSCATNVIGGDTGVLLVDLDCTGNPVPQAIFLDDRSRLELNGHSIIGGFYGVNCYGDCTILGPGEIAGMLHAGISIQKRTRVVDVDIHDCEDGIIGYDNYNDGQARLTVTDVDVHHNSEGGIGAQTVRAKNVTVDDNEYGISAFRLTAKGLSVSRNTEGGIQANKVSVKELTANDNGGAGIDAYGRVVRIRDSTLTGNNGLGLGIDFISRANRPRVIRTTCGRSGLSDGSDWNVCANDPP